MSSQTDVILLRSADEPDPYLRAFAEIDLKAESHPVLTFDFPYQAQLREHLEGGEHYAALIATSPRVGRALEAVFRETPSLAKDWKNRTAYVVGPKTAQSLSAVGLQPQGADTGSATALADRIVEEKPEGPVLFLAGNRRRDTLPHRLRSEEVDFDELVVYETRARRGLTLPSATWLVFFSPSGWDAIQASDSVDPRTYRIAAIGPTTASALRDRGLAVEAVAETPSPEGVVAALSTAHDE